MSKQHLEQAANDPVIENPWEPLRQFTAARIGLGRAGVSIPTKHLLQFQLAHAKAQDAVQTPLDFRTLMASLRQQAWCPAAEVLHLHSQAENRSVYLQRPDLGRLLDEASVRKLSEIEQRSDSKYDLAIAIVDGLSAHAITENALLFLQALIPALTDTRKPWSIAPIAVVQQGRVAIGDHIGELLRAKCVVVLIGERPGLSSPDSMGLYLTWEPRLGRTDAFRNCISNIRLAGLNYQGASRKALYLLNEARARKLSGVQLKDRSDESPLLDSDHPDNPQLEG